MSERIDHAAEAQRIISAPDIETAWNPVTMAQVHATLALVEQQKIANLLKYVEMGLSTEEDNTRIARYIDDALGLVKEDAGE